MTEVGEHESSQFTCNLRARHLARLLAAGTLTVLVLAGGLYAGAELRQHRLNTRLNPYRAYEKPAIGEPETENEYGAVGI